MSAALVAKPEARLPKHLSWTLSGGKSWKPLWFLSWSAMTALATFSILARKFSFSMISAGSISASAMMVLQRPSSISTCALTSSCLAPNGLPGLSKSGGACPERTGGGGVLKGMGCRGGI